MKKPLFILLFLYSFNTLGQDLSDIEVSRSVEWQRSTWSSKTFVAKYQWTVKNINLRRPIQCTFYIKGVTVDRSTGDVTRVADVDTYTFTLKGQDLKRLKGKLRIKLWNTYTHTGVRENKLCHYVD